MIDCVHIKNCTSANTEKCNNCKNNMNPKKDYYEPKDGWVRKPIPFRIKPYYPDPNAEPLRPMYICEIRSD